MRTKQREESCLLVLEGEEKERRISTGLAGSNPLIFLFVFLLIKVTLVNSFRKISDAQHCNSISVSSIACLPPKV